MDGFSTTEGVVVLAGSHIFDGRNAKNKAGVGGAVAAALQNYVQMIAAAKAAKATIVIVGFKAAFEYADYMMDYAANFHAGLKKLAAAENVAFVEDFYAGLRNGTYVDAKYRKGEWELQRTQFVEQTTFNNIKNALAPILPKVPTVKIGLVTKRSAIMVVGDSISDLDGVGEKGWGTHGRDDAVWTRALVDQIDSTTSTQLEQYKPYRGFDVFQGLEDGGRELAVSGNNSTQHLARLKNALLKTTPGIVVLAVTSYNDLNQQTRSL